SRGAVTEPAAETAARAREVLAAELGERPPPSPEIVELAERIRTAIRENRPEDEDELLETDPTHEAQSAGGTITGSVEGQVEEVGTSYDAMSSPPAGTPALTPGPLEQPSPTSPGMGVDAGAAAPDPIPPENTTLDADVAATDQRIADSGIDTRVTQEIPDGPFAEARDARAGLGEVAARTPQEIQAEQQQAIDSAQADMAALQQQAVAAMRSARSGTVGTVGTGQTGMVTSEENTRESVSARAQRLFDDAQRQVDQLLQPLGRTAIARWEAGLARLSQDFHDTLDRVKRWIDERHSGVGGTILAIGDYIGGLPDWVTDEYNRAEREFGDGVANLLLDISSDVNGVVAAAQALIQNARTDIDAAFQAMEAEFPEWAAQERARFTGMLNGLSQRVTDSQTSFVRDVSQRAITAVNEVHAEAQARRDEAGGLIGRVAAAIQEFIDDPVRAIINGLLRLVGIPPGAFWALIARIEQVISDIADDPENFINNLVAGVKQGFQQFFDNFGSHVLRGFWDWLFSGLETPIPMPRDFSPSSLFSFALQLMGITWPRVREILVRHVGPTAVEVIEAAWQLISVLIERGPEGIVEMIKEQLTPENIVNTILEAAVEYLMETLIQQVIVRVIGMLNPVGAIAQAIDLIYQVCSWIFRNAARIFRFVEAIVNGMADVIAGNIGGLANAVERALASLIPPVIDFLAGLLHLGGLPGEVAEVITRLQTMVYGVMDRVIGFLADRGRALLARLGLGGEEEDGEEEDGENGDEELGKTVRFTADGESHRLYVQREGSTAHLMVASTPTTIPDWIARWEAKLAEGTPPENSPERAEAESLRGQLGPAADAADSAATALAAGFEAAAQDPDPQTQAPDDSAVESAEQSVAVMLDRLFELFGEDDARRNLQAIRSALPVAGSQRGQVVMGRWKQEVIGVPRVKPVNGAEMAVWNVGAFDATSVLPNEVLASNAHHTALLRYFERPDHPIPSPQFDAFALEEPGAGHPVRAAFLTGMGRRVATQLRAEAFAGLSATAPDELLARIRTIAYAPDSDLGGFSHPFQSPVEVLVKGLFAGADFMTVLESIVQGPVNGVSFPELAAAVQASDSSYKWMKEELRRVQLGQHEWIPRSIMMEVLELAADLHSRGDTVRAIGWVRLLGSLRSPTNSVIFRLRFTSVTVIHGPGDVTERQ
ncbi:MAG: phage tail protein, partial [Nocardioides sp.]